MKNNNEPKKALDYITELEQLEQENQDLKKLLLQEQKKTNNIKLNTDKVNPNYWKYKTDCEKQVYKYKTNYKYKMYLKVIGLRAIIFIIVLIALYLICKFN